MYDRPLPTVISDLARRMAHLARLIPFGHWASYSDLSVAVGGPSYGQAASASISTAGGPIPADNPVCNRDGWSMPWHRVRGADGSIRVRCVEDRHDERAAYCNGLLQAEGGVIGADDRAAQSCRVALATLTAMAASL